MQTPSIVAFVIALTAACADDPPSDPLAPAEWEIQTEPGGNASASRDLRRRTRIPW